MKQSNRKYKITVEDESHLTQIASGRFSKTGLWLIGVSAVIVAIFIGGLLVTVTPLRTLLPGYLKESQRSAAEDGLLRLDSLMSAYEVTQAYIDNYLKVIDTNRVPGDSAAIVPTSRELSADSLSTTTNLEQHFVSQMQERERFNISVLAPLAADGVIFSPVTPDCVFTAETKDSDNPKVLIPSEESIQNAADGTVIALYHSPSERGYTLVVQHPRGFVTSYSGTGTPLVGIGDNVYAGQIIALSPRPDSKGVRSLTLRMWHNGLALKPYTYLSPVSRDNRSPAPGFETPRGR